MMTLTVDLNNCKKDIEANGRKFAPGAFENAIKDFIEANTVDEKFKPVLGELVHEDPQDFTLNLSNVSHSVSSIDIDTMIAKIDLLDTPQGKLAQQFVNDLNFGVRASCHYEEIPSQEGEEPSEEITSQEGEELSRELHIDQIFSFDIIGLKRNND